jgi:glycosyltransferase involved in cell wall biosynthesis
MDFIFDVVELAPGMGKSIGIYNYALRLFEAMRPMLGPDLRMHLVCNAGCVDAFDTEGSPHVIKHVVIKQTQPSALQRQLWLRWGAQRLARRLGVTVYFTPKGFIPGWWGRSRGLRTVAVIHDLIALWYAEHQPGYFGRFEQMVVIQALLRTARHANELVVISQASADDVARRVGRGQRVHVLHNGVPWVAPRQGSPVATPYIFAVTSRLPHKNAQGVLSAYALYRQAVPEPLPLVVCGIDDPGQPGVTAVKGIDDETLHTYYAHASLFVFLSLIEGFGFPPLEAMQHGTPVLCSDIDSLKEVTAGAATLVDPLDPQAVASSMARLLANPALLRQQSDAAVHLARRYDWQACAQGIKALLLAQSA